MTRDGAWIETGGFGPQFDDLGSGYWIGREGIAAVLRAEHGGGPATRLRDAVPATEALLKNPHALAYDPSGNLYVADRDSFVVRRVDAGGASTIVAGTGAGGQGEGLRVVLLVDPRGQHAATQEPETAAVGGVDERQRRQDPDEEATEQR